MRNFSKITILMFLAVFLVAGSAMALPLTTGLEGVFDNIATDGNNDVDVYSDMIGDDSDSYWNITATTSSAATFIIEIAGYANTNSFGIYDVADSNNRVELFSGADTTADQIAVTIDAYGNVKVVDITDTVTIPGFGTVSPITTGAFSSTTFGYYIDVAETGFTYFSDTALNTDGSDHMLAYQGVGENVDLDQGGDLASGDWTNNEFILAFEDLNLFARNEAGEYTYDGDFTDLVVMVESVQPVPEPATLFLLGSGLLGFAGSRRRKEKK